MSTSEAVSIAAASAKQLFEQLQGHRGIVTVRSGRGCLTTQGLQQGLTVWYVADFPKMAHVLLPAGIKADDVLEDVQNELDQLRGAQSTAK
jgi:hypothetical protein